MKKLITICLILFLMYFAASAFAGYVPPCSSVPGKEYTDNPDEDAATLADPHQVLHFDGGGNVVNSFDYTGAGGYPTDSQVDALANHGDAYFYEVTHDLRPMLVSSKDKGNILWTDNGAGAHATRVGTWCTAVQINQNSPPQDVDGLEVWGPDEIDDADMFSLAGDPLVGNNRVSVWAYNSLNHIATPSVTAAQIAAAIGRTDLASDIDLDGLMTYYSDIMFSIAPIDVFDGGEIWVWTIGGGPALFLVHGGEVWDTAHSVVGHFAGLDVTENINALEAVPEPATICILCLGALSLIRRKK